MENYIKGRDLSSSDVVELLSLNEEDITLSLLKDYFAYRKNNEPKFNVNDRFTLEANILGNKERVRTTVGKYIFNLFILKPKLINYIGYYNKVLNKKNIGGLDGKVSSLFLEDKISSEDIMMYIDKMQWLSYGISSFLNSSLTHEMLLLPDSVKQRKEELISKHKKAIDDGDIFTATKIEKELIEMSKEIMKNLPDYEIYESGARGSFGNNFKNTSIMRGPIKNLANPDSVKISTHSLDEGIPPEELPYYADLLTQASFQRAVGTQDGGYEGKKLAAAFQSVVLDEPNSDCKTDATLKIELKPEYAKLFLYRYINVNGKLVLLTTDNIDSYKGKFVNVRSPLFCKGDQICSKCAGELYYLMGIRNVGLLTNRVGSSILNAALKAFHDMSLKVVELDIDNYLE